MKENLRYPFHSERQSFIQRHGRSIVGLYTILTLAFFIASLFGCGQTVTRGADTPTEKFDSPQGIISVLESAITTFGGAADDEVGESFGHLLEGSVQPERICTNRPGVQKCQSSGRRANYGSCISADGIVLSGEVSLNYNQSDCEFSSHGDHAVRHQSVRLTSSEGSGWEISSQQGGGTRITKESNGEFTIEIFGVHKSRTFNGKRTADVFIQSDSIKVHTAAGFLERNGRRVSSGQIRVSHSAPAYTADLNLKRLEYSAGCCYPTAGTIEVEYKGAISGFGTVKFTGCGLGEFSYNGMTHPMTLSYCE